MARDPHPRPPPRGPFRIKLLSLSSRVIGILIPMLDLSQVYKLSKISKKWQAAVKATETMLEKLTVDLESDIYRIGVTNGSKSFVIGVPHHRTMRIEENNTTVVENARKPHSERSRTNQIAIALRRLSKMFYFKHTSLTMGAQPDLYQTVKWLSFTCYLEFDFLRFGGAQYSISRTQLRLIMKMLFGKEILIENVAIGEPERLPTNFEMITSLGSNWFTNEMLMRIPCREVHLRQERNEITAVSIDVLGALVKKWHEGAFVKLRYFSCCIFVRFVARNRVNVLNNVLQTILAGIPVMPREPNDIPDNVRERALLTENRVFIERTDGRCALLFIPVDTFKTFHFRVWIRNQQNDKEDINDPLHQWGT